MKYEDMTKHEINMAVTCITRDCNGWAVSASNMGFYHCGIDGNEFEEVEVIDYCNNPNDAWSIIESIWSTLNSVTEYDLSTQIRRIKTTTWRATMCEYKCSAFKAAMICYLKMKDAENENC